MEGAGDGDGEWRERYKADLKTNGARLGRPKASSRGGSGTAAAGSSMARASLFLEN